MNKRVYEVRKRVESYAGRVTGASVNYLKRALSAVGVIPWNLGYYASQKSVFKGSYTEGIILYIVTKMQIRSGFCVEIGAHNGLFRSNTAHLLNKKGWRGVLIEADRKLFEECRARYKDNSKVAVLECKVTPENIEELLGQSHVPLDLDLLSIDIDGNDFYIWQRLNKFRAKLVIVEYNRRYPPPLEYVSSYDPDFADDTNPEAGASLQSLYNLGTSMGYELLGSHRPDLYFVLKEYIHLFPNSDRSCQNTQASGA